MKKVIILLTLLFIFMGLKTNVYASTYTDKFYISEEIEGISYAKEKDGKISYRKAIFKKRRSDNKIVYCIEPFSDLKEEFNYSGYDYNYEKLLNLSKEDWNRISLLSYYGYGYENHIEGKWYAITQILIWETIDKKASFYWTDTFKGKKVTRFTNEINELNKLVNNHNKKPSFDELTYDMSIDSTLVLEDKNMVLSNYEIINKDNLDIKINNNKLEFKSKIKDETINIKLQKKDNKYGTFPIIYVSDTYQDVLAVGSYETIMSELTINIGSGNLKIIKKDSDTNTIIPQGEASLIGTTYELFDENNKLIDVITINESNEGILSNIKYGNYKLKEKSSGIGYRLDTNEYFFNINKENKNIELELTNEVVKSKVKITKYLSNENNKQVEKNIKFQIINNKNEIYKEVTTNDHGILEFDLPYGTYTIKQINTTEGYYKVEDFQIIIDENTNNILEYYLYDLKVPDTSEKKYNKLILVLLIYSTILLIIKKEYDKTYQ